MHASTRSPSICLHFLSLLSVSIWLTRTACLSKSALRIGSFRLACGNRRCFWGKAGPGFVEYCHLLQSFAAKSTFTKYFAS